MADVVVKDFDTTLLATAKKNYKVDFQALKLFVIAILSYGKDEDEQLTLLENNDAHGFTGFTITTETYKNNKGITLPKHSKMRSSHIRDDDKGHYPLKHITNVMNIDSFVYNECFNGVLSPLTRNTVICRFMHAIHEAIWKIEVCFYLFNKSEYCYDNAGNLLRIKYLEYNKGLPSKVDVVEIINRNPFAITHDYSDYHIKCDAKRCFNKIISNPPSYIAGYKDFV
jgi:hypothetical protein